VVAAQRARLADDDLAARFKKWPLWLSGEAQPTLRQLEDFARLTHTPFGYFFLPEPPVLALPVPDYRTLRDAAFAEPSSNLLDTLYLCQQRQDWYRDHARMHGLPVLPFVGSANVQEAPETVAQRLRETLGLSSAARRQLPTWTDALRQLIAKAEDAGVMVMVSSVVGSNSYRKLDVDEFRGFALADGLAPLVFLNGADSKAAQMFTLAHELAHVWLGATGVSDPQAGQVPEQQTERWCNQLAAELLIPLEELVGSAPAQRADPGRNPAAGASVQGQHAGHPEPPVRRGLPQPSRAVAALPRGTGAAAHAEGAQQSWRRLLPQRGCSHQQTLCPRHRIQHAGGPDLVSGCLSHAGRAQDGHLL